MARPLPELVLLTYTVPQAAVVTNLSDDTVRAKVNNGDIPSFRVGRRVLISRIALDRWVQEQSGSFVPNSEDVAS